MGNDVFANGREISCKSADGKSICAFPDVCFTPPQTPATPPGVPIPYPNTGLARDTTSGSRSVKISGKEVMLKNKSYFKKSLGDEAGCAPKKGVVTSVNRGKVYFTSWSMDVKYEGENVVRHIDLTTHNHACEPGQTTPWPFMDAMAVDKDPCNGEKAAEQTACSKHGKDRGKKCSDPNCRRAQKCKLVAYGGKGSPNCCPGLTGDHLVEASSFATKREGGTLIKGCEKYDLDKAPTCCVEGGAYSAEHGQMSCLRGYGATQCPEGRLELTDGHDPKEVKAKHVTTLGDAKKRAAKALHLVFPGCTEDCILAQLDNFDTKHGLKDDTKIRAITYGDPDKWTPILKVGKALETLKKLIAKTGTGGSAM